MKLGSPSRSSLTPLAQLLVMVLGIGCVGTDQNQEDLQPVGIPTPTGASRCTIDSLNLTLTCPHQTTTIDLRAVHYQVPLGSPPTGGWPVVINFQGSLFPADLSWVAFKGEALGAYNQTLVIKNLLDAGYAMITPTTVPAGTGPWDTNIPPYSGDWQNAPDHPFMLHLFDAINAGAFGPLSSTRWYATGVSSGGYMTSRMAVSYPGRFKALAIESGSYATCAGPLCTIPNLPADHPPTLFLHGALDPAVPVITMFPYRDKLSAMGIRVRSVVDPLFMHGWIDASPTEVLNWFNSVP